MKEPVKSFNAFVKINFNEKEEWPLSIMDDYGDIIDLGQGYKIYANSKNNNMISESSLNRILSFKDRDWAIITAHRDKFNKETNIKRNRILRGILDKNKMGPHQLVGHWRECQLPGVNYEECPSHELKDVVERSYFVVKPNSMETSAFYDLMLSLMTIQGETQDAIVYHDSEKDDILVLGSDGTVFSKYKNWNIGKISQAYSQYVKKTNVPFIFEGMEIPSSNSGRMVMKCLNIQYLTSDTPMVKIPSKR